MESGSRRGRSRERSASRSVRARSRSVARIARPRFLKGIHQFQRTLAINVKVNPAKGFIEASGGATIGYIMAMTFRLNGVQLKGAGVYSQPYALPNVGEFTALFDSYRIDRVDIKMISGVTTVGVQTTTGHTMPSVWIVNDHDDGLPPTSTGEFLQRENMKVVSFSDNNIKNHTVYPRIATQHYNGIVLSGYGQGNKYSFIDCANGDVEYYGTKFCFPSPASSLDLDLGTIQFLVKYNMTFKGVI